jgi:hypothetical protein
VCSCGVLRGVYPFVHVLSSTSPSNSTFFFSFFFFLKKKVPCSNINKAARDWLGQLGRENSHTSGINPCASSSLQHAVPYPVRELFFLLADWQIPYNSSLPLQCPPHTTQHNTPTPTHTPAPPQETRPVVGGAVNVSVRDIRSIHSSRPRLRRYFEVQEDILASGPGNVIEPQPNLPARDARSI